MLASIQDRRRAELGRALNAVGCVLREDSHLCNSYIYYGGVELQDVVNTMEEMKFFFAHTKYKEIFDGLHQIAQDEYDMAAFEFDYDRHEDSSARRRKTRPLFRHFFDRHSASQTAKEMALTEFIVNSYAPECYKLPSTIHAHIHGTAATI
jgi:hypothetical protein